MDKYLSLKTLSVITISVFAGWWHGSAGEVWSWPDFFVLSVGGIALGLFLICLLTKQPRM